MLQIAMDRAVRDEQFGSPAVQKPRHRFVVHLDG